MIAQGAGVPVAGSPWVVAAPRRTWGNRAGAVPGMTPCTRDDHPYLAARPRHVHVLRRRSTPWVALGHVPPVVERVRARRDGVPARAPRRVYWLRRRHLG